MDLHALLDDVEGVHEGVGGDCCAGAACCWVADWSVWDVVWNANFELAYRPLAGDVQRHCHPWLASRLRMLQSKPRVQVLSSYQLTFPSPPYTGYMLIPAPNTTLDSPLHNDI